MTNRIPSPIKFLFDRHARLTTEHEKVQMELAILNAHINAVKSRQEREIDVVRIRHEREMERELQHQAAIESHLTEIACSMNAFSRVLMDQDLSVEKLKPIATQTSVRPHGYGEIRKLVLQCLAQDPYRKYTTGEVISYVASNGSTPIAGNLYDRSRTGVKEALKALVKLGRVVRHHLKSARSEGSWSLGDIGAGPSDESGELQEFLRPMEALPITPE